jgi:hypothetical protein
MAIIFMIAIFVERQIVILIITNYALGKYKDIFE